MKTAAEVYEYIERIQAENISVEDIEIPELEISELAQLWRDAEIRFSRAWQEVSCSRSNEFKTSSFTNYFGETESVATVRQRLEGDVAKAMERIEYARKMTVELEQIEQAGGRAEYEAFMLFWSARQSLVNLTVRLDDAAKKVQADLAKKELRKAARLAAKVAAV